MRVFAPHVLGAGLLAAVCENEEGTQPMPRRYMYSPVVSGLDAR
jgi:hypothetical protein